MATRKPAKTSPAINVPGTIATTTTLRSPVGQWCHDWQEVAVWKPLLVLVMLLLFWAIPRVDPQSGIDGFGDVFHLVGRLLVLSALYFSAWLAQKTYLRVIDEDQEEALFDRAVTGDRDALIMLVLNRVEFLVLLCVGLFVLR